MHRISKQGVSTADRQQIVKRTLVIIPQADLKADPGLRPQTADQIGQAAAKG